MQSKMIKKNELIQKNDKAIEIMGEIIEGMDKEIER